MSPMAVIFAARKTAQCLLCVESRPAADPAAIPATQQDNKYTAPPMISMVR